jgi:hypothetical protein
VDYFSSSHVGPGYDRRPPPRRAEPGEWPKSEAALAVVNRDLMATRKRNLLAERLAPYPVVGARRHGEGALVGGAVEVGAGDEVVVALDDGEVSQSVVIEFAQRQPAAETPSWRRGWCVERDGLARQTGPVPEDDGDRTGTLRVAFRLAARPTTRSA